MINKFTFIVLLAMAAFAAGAQTAPPPSVPRDTIFKVNGSLLAVDVTAVTPTYISFVFPENLKKFTIERKEVHKIVYKTGKG
jgi:hypothetical protein